MRNSIVSNSTFLFSTCIVGRDIIYLNGYTKRSVGRGISSPDRWKLISLKEQVIKWNMIHHKHDLFLPIY